MVLFSLYMLIFMCNEEEDNWRRKSISISIGDKWNVGVNRVLTNWWFFFFNNEKFFCMQFGLTKMFSIEEVMMHICHVPLMPRQRKDSSCEIVSCLWHIANKQFWGKRVVKAEGSNGGSLVYGCGPHVGNLHSIFLHNRTWKLMLNLILSFQTFNW